MKDLYSTKKLEKESDHNFMIDSPSFMYVRLSFVRMRKSIREDQGDGSCGQH
jgi:hypothetical protein